MREAASLEASRARSSRLGGSLAAEWKRASQGIWSNGLSLSSATATGGTEKAWKGRRSDWGFVTGCWGTRAWPRGSMVWVGEDGLGLGEATMPRRQVLPFWYHVSSPARKRSEPERDQRTG